MWTEIQQLVVFIVNLIEIGLFLKMIFDHYSE